MNRLSLANCDRKLSLLARYLTRNLNNKAAASSSDIQETKARHVNDFYGINDVTATDVAGEYVLDKSSADPVEKYSKLMHSRTEKDNEPTIAKSTFGKVRLDSENLPKYHGQFDPSNERLSFDVEQEVDNFEAKRFSKLKEQNSENRNSTTAENDGERPIDDQYFSSLNELADKVSSKTSHAIGREQKEDSNYIDSMYFEKYFPRSELASQVKKKDIGKYEFVHSKHFHEWIEEQNDGDTYIRETFEAHRRKREEEMGRTNLKVIEGIKLSRTSPLKSPEEIAEDFDDMREKMRQEIAEVETDLVSAEEESPEFATGIKVETPPTPRTAFEYITQLKRRQIVPETDKMKQSLSDHQRDYRLPGEDLFSKMDSTGSELDSKGYRTYRDAVFDLSKVRKADIIMHLKNQIVYCGNGLVAINKPYGLSVQGTEEFEKSKVRKEKEKGKLAEPSFFDMLPEFAELLYRERYIEGMDGKAPKLHTIHRLDKEVTGVLLLATNQEVARHVHKLFSERQVEKEYLALTRNVPSAEEGIIDIPIDIGSIEGKQRMVLRPELQEELRRIAAPSTQARRAVTYYKVLNSVANASVLKIIPETGVKHQIRAHLGLGLRCPILGDHKYTYLDKLAPQRLPADMLLALSVRQSKVRNIPMHLHSKVLVLPEVGPNGSSIVIRAKVPNFFRDTLSKLKLAL